MAHFGAIIPRRLLLRHRYNELFELLSPELRQNVVQLMSQKTLETVWYFRVLKSMGEGMTDGNALKYKRQGTECLVELALAMKREAFAPREKMTSEKLSIVMRGVAAKAGNILTVTMHWGEDMIVSSAALRDGREASALTYVEIMTLSRDDCFEVLSRFPEAEKEIREAAMKLAMQRAIVVISDLIQESSKDEDGTAGWGKAMGGGAMMPGGKKIDPFTWLQVISGNKEKDFDPVTGELIEVAEEDAAAGAPGSPGFAERGMLTELKTEMREMKKEMGEVKALLRKIAAKDEMPGLG